jgi:malate permease and related proteins
MKLAPTTVGALILTGSLENTSFTGLPMIEAFYGAQGLGVGIIIDQAGSYFVLSTLGVGMATLLSAGETPGIGKIARKIISFIPFQAFILALLLIPVVYPAWLDEVLRRLGGTLVPIALVSVGYQTAAEPGASVD